MTKYNSVEMIMQEMLSHTQLLEKCISNPDSEPEEWLELLEEREQMIEELSRFIEKGEIISDHIRTEYLAKVYEINQRLVPVVINRKQDVSTKLAKLKQSQVVNRQYTGDGAPVAYGAFFDKKK
ncbi:MAG: flagellar protein FliT [Brevibacillus sp.]|nr:MAG: flagellar protein FliT [Brevibacillus sp.]